MSYTLGAFTMCVLKCKIECVKLVDEKRAEKSIERSLMVMRLMPSTIKISHRFVFETSGETFCGENARGI